MVWAAIGKPNQRERLAAEWDKNGINEGLFPSGYRLFDGRASEPLRRMITENETARRAAPSKSEAPALAAAKKPVPIEASKLWSGWMLPASDGDLWITAGAAAYHDALSSPDPVKAIERFRASARAVLLDLDTPLTGVQLRLDNDSPNRVALLKGALVFDALRTELGDEKFFAFMRGFMDANTTRTVSTAAFREAAGKAAGKPLDAFFDSWLMRPGLPGDKGGPSYAASDMMRRFDSILIVYGTMADAGANRYAAEQFRLFDNFEYSPVIRKDFELTAEELRTHDVVFIGRPEANQALAAIAKQIGLEYDGAAFRVDGKVNASEYDALSFAANPLNPKRMVLVLAGNSALETVKLTKAEPASVAVAISRSGKRQ